MSDTNLLRQAATSSISITHGWPTAEEMMAAAQERTGLCDFGPPSFREGLNHMLASLEQDAHLTAEGRADIIPVLERRLQNRLRVEEWHRRNPSASSAEIKAPISITGLPRTGTTALANMMSLDTQFRSLRPWEQAHPCPPPKIETEDQDPRRLEMIRMWDALAREKPEQMAMHLYDADATEEDHDVLGIDFAAQHTIWPVFGYHRWWRNADMRPAYLYHRRVLQLLQSHRPPNLWLLKAPHHTFHLEAILNAYPDIRFIFTHRDPTKVVPSYLSFATSLYPPGSIERLGIEKIGQQMYAHLLSGMHRAVEARNRLGSSHFIDIEQRELDQDPIGTLKRIYAYLDLEFTTNFEEKVKIWHSDNRSGAHGTHRYSTEQFGLYLERIRSDYAFYTKYFDFDW